MDDAPLQHLWEGEKPRAKQPATLSDLELYNPGERRHGCHMKELQPNWVQGSQDRI